MHKFLRAVGFSEYKEKKQIDELIREVILHADERSYTTRSEKSLYAEFARNFADEIGIAVCGEFDDEDNYSFDYYFPYLQSKIVSTGEDISVRGTSLSLSGLSCDGTIMKKKKKTEWQKKKIQKDTVTRNRLIQAARGGDEEAIESLTLEDMDTYTTISRRIQKMDVFSLVDTYCMPYGV